MRKSDAQQQDRQQADKKDWSAPPFIGCGQIDKSNHEDPRQDGERESVIIRKGPPYFSKHKEHGAHGSEIPKRNTGV
jgi:hypothetical protein